MRILVVEDEREIAEGITKILETEGYQVDAVHDGLLGMDGIFSEVYDLVLLDVMLPKINGFEIIKNVRNEGIKTPIILLTAKSQIDDKIQGLNLGADDYITKPFDARELLARIGARVRNQADLKNGKYQAYDIALDPLTYKLEKVLEEGQTGKTVKLSKTEYALMEYFMLNKNQILSKDMIIERIWGDENDTDYNNIEVYVSFLRKKLKFVQSSSLIQTKKGVGYSFGEGTE